ncbi:MAG TPA: DAK2 domain-containing protein, partial [Solirubrobacteraceae bacterium]|nr:DAK2 domain-containing protein [Solirubrobacteraceae bacterium]
ATLIGAALANAADRAYASVRDPAEGTILTVVREMAHKIMTDVAHSPDDPRLGPATTAPEQDAVIAETLERAVIAGQESVKRGPELLSVLREAGVVDAGGYGLTIMFAGVVAALRGAAAPELDHYAPARISHPQHSSSTYRFCTNFAVTGSELSAPRFIAPLEELGDSVLVVGDSRTLKVHVHTDLPERATAVFADAGEVSRLDVADMRLQVARRDERVGAPAAGAAAPAGGGEHQHALPARHSNGLTRARCGAVAVVNGPGLEQMFRELGVHTIDGGPTLNPSTYDLLAGIHEVPAEEVVVLPNSANVVLSAEHAARMSDKQVLVAPTMSQQAGLAAAVALVPERSVEENARALTDALARVRTGAVAEASRDDAQGRFRRGDAVGFIEQEVLAWGDPADTLRAVLGRLARADNGSAPELISVLAGEGAPLDLAEVQAIAEAGVELELRTGGQPAYWWLLAAE